MATEGWELLGGHLTCDEVRGLDEGRDARRRTSSPGRALGRGLSFRGPRRRRLPGQGHDPDGPATRLKGEVRTLKLPDGYWRVERTGGLLPPMIGVYKRVRGEEGETWAGPLLRWPFRLEVCAGHVDLIYAPPFSLWVDELRPEETGLWLGTATLGGRPVGRFRMVRIG